MRSDFESGAKNDTGSMIFFIKEENLFKMFKSMVKYVHVWDVAFPICWRIENDCVIIDLGLSPRKKIVCWVLFGLILHIFMNGENNQNKKQAFF